MQRIVLSSIISMVLVVSFSPVFAEGQTIQAEQAEHPRIARAIADLNDAVAYMEAAPHNFGGHKAKAISASQEAIRQLEKALAYRARQDQERGR